jgi:hypothetical protein
MATTDLDTSTPAATDVGGSGHWLIEQLREEQRQADRRRLSALLATHALPRQRTGS